MEKFKALVLMELLEAVLVQTLLHRAGQVHKVIMVLMVHRQTQVQVQAAAEELEAQGLKAGRNQIIITNIAYLVKTLWVVTEA